MELDLGEPVAPPAPPPAQAAEPSPPTASSAAPSQPAATSQQAATAAAPSTPRLHPSGAPRSNPRRNWELEEAIASENARRRLDGLPPIKRVRQDHLYLAARGCFGEVAADGRC